MIAFPLGFLIFFFSSQYTKERWLEEQYAFKSNISLSLEPFENFVGRMSAKEQDAELKKHREFVVGLINKVFTEPAERPTDKITDSGLGYTTESLEKIMKVLKPLLDATKGIK